MLTRLSLSWVEWPNSLLLSQIYLALLRWDLACELKLIGLKVLILFILKPVTPSNYLMVESRCALHFPFLPAHSPYPVALWFWIQKRIKSKSRIKIRM